MSVTIELLDAVKARNGGVSDYAAAKILGVTQPTVSGWRSGYKRMGAETCLLICQKLEIDPAPYLVRLQIEGANGDKLKNAWEAVAVRLSGLKAIASV